MAKGDRLHQFHMIDLTSRSEILMAGIVVNVRGDVFEMIGLQMCYVADPSRRWHQVNPPNQAINAASLTVIRHYDLAAPSQQEEG